jgi:integrase
VALATGARQSELAGLRWSDLDLDERTLRISRSIQQLPKMLRADRGDWLEQGTKTRRSNRVIPIPEVAVEALRRQRAALARERLAKGHIWRLEYGDLVFWERTGTPLIGSNITKRLQYQLSKLGLPRVRFHDLRHSAATFLAIRRVPVAVAMAVLGHSSASTTLEVYTRVAPELAREAAEAMDDALRGG